MTNGYSIEQHRHNFSVWAAARAAQRGFTDVNNLRNALEQCGIREFLSNNSSNSTSNEEYTTLHSRWGNSIMQYLESLGIADVTFGRAAKLIAIYIKSMVIMSEPSSSLAITAHPPIDAVLLKNISKDTNLPKQFRQKCSKIKWTQLDESRYLILLDELKKYVILDQPMWTLERYWTVTQNT